MNVKMEPSWKTALTNEFEKAYFQQLAEFVKFAYKQTTIYPHPSKMFRAFEMCPVDKVRVVILGQDPYHGPGQANGLCFSVHDGVPFPPSLLNIYKEIQVDLGTPIPRSGDLDRWAQQGVLLLNATLTVEAHKAGSHQGKGWEEFTDAVVSYLAEEKQDLVFILWGAYAQRKGEVIDRTKHLVLEAPHPSPLSAHRGFFGSGHFSKANVYLMMHGKEAVEW